LPKKREIDLKVEGWGILVKRGEKRGEKKRWSNRRGPRAVIAGLREEQGER